MKNADTTWNITSPGTRSISVFIILSIVLFLADAMAHPSQERPLFSFGLISDVQYADADDGHDYTGTRRRSYRNSLQGLREAVTSWNTSQFPVKFVLQLGDLVDARNKEKGQSRVALARVLQECQRFKGEFHHIWGNHEFYNFSRTELYDLPLSPAYVEQNPFVFDSAPSDGLKISVPMPGDINNNGGYYSFSPNPDFLFIMLDTYGKSMLGYEPDSPEFKESEAFLKSMNPNTDLNDPSGLEGVAQRLCMFNGAVDDSQLIWLDNTLKGAEANGQKVVVAGERSSTTRIHIQLLKTGNGHNDPSLVVSGGTDDCHYDNVRCHQ